MIARRNVVVGIDVGSMRKGFHAVALLNGRYFNHTSSSDVDAITDWCRINGAQAIGIDAPCCWSRDGRARTAERELMAKRIACFSTPTLERAEAHPSDYFGWMRNGARLYTALQPHYPLFDGMGRTPVCFETFPHAIACELTGEIPPKHEKVHRRQEILEAAGVATARLSNVDLRDAALCALTANALLSGRFVMYGHEDDGFIIVPKCPRDSVVLPVPA